MEDIVHAGGKICCFVAKVHFFAIYALFFFKQKIQMSLFYPFRGEGSLKGDNFTLFYRFSYYGFPKLLIAASNWETLLILMKPWSRMLSSFLSVINSWKFRQFGSKAVGIFLAVYSGLVPTLVNPAWL